MQIVFQDFTQFVTEFREFCKSGGDFFSIPLLVFFCLVFGWGARKLKLPTILGYMVGGLAMGHGVLDLISDKTSDTLLFINHIALGLMALSIGTHINFHRLRNSGKRVLVISLFDNLFPFILVYVVSRHLFGQSTLLSLLLAAISISTAPATTIALVDETRSKGTLVNTLMPVVALNNVTCIFLFTLIITYMDLFSGGHIASFQNLVAAAGVVVKEILKSGIIAVLCGYALRRYVESKTLHKGESLTIIFFFIMAVTGLSMALNIMGMLTCLFMGIYISNFGTNRKTIVQTFEDTQHMILVLFFGMAGTHLSFSNFSLAAWLIFGFFAARFFGKVMAGMLGSWLTCSPVRLTRYLGFTLTSQAGVAIGLVILAFEVPQLKGISDLLATIVMISVNINEFVGPIIGKWALIKSGEAGQDRLKLIDFIGEEFINANIKSTNKTLALEEMSKFLLKSHNLPQDRLEEFLGAVLEREGQQSTGIGAGVAIPHGVIETGEEIIGVIGRSRKGIEYGSPDGKKVYLIIMLITPKSLNTRHLKVLAEIIKLVQDSPTRRRLLTAKTAAQLYEVVHRIEHDKFNYFLDD